MQTESDEMWRRRVEGGRRGGAGWGEGTGGEREGVTTSVFSLDIRLPHPVSHQWTVALISTIGEKKFDRNSFHVGLRGLLLFLQIFDIVLALFSTLSRPEI